MNHVTNVVVEGGISSIGNYAFTWCTGIRSVSVADSVREIKEGAFQSCYALDNINIPEGVSVLGNYAFAYCSSLKKITLPSTLTVI